MLVLSVEFSVFCFWLSACSNACALLMVWTPHLFLRWGNKFQLSQLWEVFVYLWKACYEVQNRSSLKLVTMNASTVPFQIWRSIEQNIHTGWPIVDYKILNTISIVDYRLCLKSLCIIIRYYYIYVSFVTDFDFPCIFHYIYVHLNSVIWSLFIFLCMFMINWLCSYSFFSFYYFLF